MLQLLCLPLLCSLLLLKFLLLLALLLALQLLLCCLLLLLLLLLVKLLDGAALALWPLLGLPQGGSWRLHRASRGPRVHTLCLQNTTL